MGYIGVANPDKWLGSMGYNLVYIGIITPINGDRINGL